MTTSDCRWCGDTGTVPGPDVPCPRCSPQSQGVPTVTREHREAAVVGYAGSLDNALEHERTWVETGAPRTGHIERLAGVAQLLATHEAAAHERGRSQAAGDGLCSLDAWTEEDGDVLWWVFPVNEPPYVGSPLDDDWPGYHTHWQRIALPTPPSDSGKGD